MKNGLKRILSLGLAICLLFMVTPQIQVSALRGSGVIYDGNGSTGGSAPTDSTTYSSGDTVTVAENTGNLVKKYNVFDGWNTLADGSGTNYKTSETFTYKGNITLYAKWISEDPSLKFDTVVLNLGPNAWLDNFALDSNGNIYITDCLSTYKLKKYNSSGQLLWQVGTSGSGSGQFQSPFSLDIDSSNNIYLADINRHRIIKYDSNGVLKAEFGAGAGGGGVDSITNVSSPYDVTVDRVSGNILVADTANKRVLKLNSSLQYMSHFSVATESTNPAAICTDDSGNIYVGDQYSKKVIKYNSSGTKLASLTSDNFSAMKDLYYDGTYIFAGTNNILTKLLPSDLSIVYSWTGVGAGGLEKDSAGNILFTGYQWPDRVIKKSRVASNNKNLNSLTVNGQTLSPGFSKNILDYTITVDSSVTSVSLTPVAAESHAVIRTNGATWISGTPQVFSLGLGDNPIPIEVTADDGSKQTYTVTVKVPIPPDQIIVRASDAGYGNASVPDYGTSLFCGYGGYESGLKFDLSGISQTILSASLNVKVYGELEGGSYMVGDSCNYSLYGSNDDSWTGGASLPNTKDSLIIESIFEHSPPDYWKSIDVKNFVTNHISSEGSICSFILSSTEAESYVSLYDQTGALPNKPYIFVRIPAIDKSSADFDKSNQSDISFNIILEDTLSSIKIGDTIVDSSNYSINNKFITLKKEFLATLPLGLTDLTVNMNQCSPQILSVNVVGDIIPPTVPTLEASVTLPTNSDVTVTITYSDDSATKEYKVDAGEWTAYTAPVVVTANSTVYARGTDTAGNTSSEGSLAIANIDKAAPSIPTLEASTTLPTNSDVTVTITYSGDSATKEYKLDDGEWTPYTAPVVVTANSIVYARGTDISGNTSSEGSLAIINIDKAAPTVPNLEASTILSTNSDVTVTITYSGDSATKEYKVGSGDWTPYTAPVVVTANSTVYARCTDTAGNTSEEGSLTITNIDKAAPTVPNLEASTILPTNSDVTVTITYSGDSATKEYKVNAGEWTPYTAPVVVSANSTVYARGTDTASNTSSEGSLTVTNIDKTAPTVPTLEASTILSTNSNVTVTITYSGDSATKEYKVGSGEWTPYTAPVVVTANATVYARSADTAENTSSEGSLTVTNIDKAAPTVPTLETSTILPTNSNVTVTIIYSGDSTTKEYKVDAGDWTPYTAPVVVSANATVYARGTDTAGNTSEEGSLVIANIDKTAPTATFEYDITAATTGTVTVTLIPSESITVTNNNSLTTYTFTKSGTFTFEFIDTAGNTGSAIVTVSNIYLLGDVNNDGFITPSDALMILQIVAGKRVPTEQQLACADVTKDNDIQSSDALKILHYVSGKISSL